MTVLLGVVQDTFQTERWGAPRPSRPLTLALLPSSHHRLLLLLPTFGLRHNCLTLVTLLTQFKVARWRLHHLSLLFVFYCYRTRFLLCSLLLLLNEAILIRLEHGQVARAQLHRACARVSDHTHAAIVGRCVINVVQLHRLGIGGAIKDGWF